MITTIDHTILLWITTHLRFAWLTPFWKCITTLGEGGIFWILLCVVFLIPKKTRKIGIIMALALIINALLVNVWLKNMIARVRPYDAYNDIIRLIAIQKDYSFPSGHTSASFACSCALWLALEKPYKKYTCITWVIACLIAFSRLYLGVHYPSDIIGGAIVGSISAMLAYYVYPKIESRFARGK